jgi:MFS transporter, SET family, sugar efflux transporter
MFKSLSPLWRDPTLRLVVLIFVLVGALLSSLAPYLSLIAITRLGFSEQAYSVILIVASVLSLASSIGIGILTDQRPLRRQMALLSAFLITLGTALMWLIPSKITFALSHAILMPCGFTIMILVFALSSLGTQAYPATRDTLRSAIRASFALPFVVVLPLWSVALKSGADVMAIYPFATVVGVATFAVIWVSWPKDGAASWTDAKSGLSFFQSLKEMAEFPVLFRVLLLGAVSSAGTLYIVLVGLVFTQASGRDASDAALYVGLVAGAEVPFMLMAPHILRNFSKVALIVAGTALYCVHLVLMPIIAATGFVWLLILPAAVGGAIILTLPIAYLQDLLAARPGAGSSLISVQRVVGDTFAASAFAVGTYASGYGTAALIGAAAALSGAIGLLLADRVHQSKARPI